MLIQDSAPALALLFLRLWFRGCLGMLGIRGCVHHLVYTQNIHNGIHAANYRHERRNNACCPSVVLAAAAGCRGSCCSNLSSFLELIAVAFAVASVYGINSVLVIWLGLPPAYKRWRWMRIPCLMNDLLKVKFAELLVAAVRIAEFTGDSFVMFLGAFVVHVFVELPRTLDQIDPRLGI
jgi:hypothetical protein